MEEQNAIGGNFKFKHLKVFGSVENFYKNEKRYRRVFDASECRYIYAELSFYNKLFDEREWNVNVRYVCINVQTKDQICELNKKITVKKDMNIVNVREGWGTKDPGWWKKGQYRWDAYIEDRFVGSTHFYIVDSGPVTETSNPYINISYVKLFESPLEGIAKDKRKYLKTFSKNSTRYINVEVDLDIINQKEEIMPLEFVLNFYNDAGQHKSTMEYFKVFNDKRPKVTFDTGYGSNQGNFWYGDKYTLEIQFMNQLIGVVSFEVGEEEEEMKEPLSFGIRSRQPQSTTEIKIQEGKFSYEEATEELNSLIGLDSVKRDIDELATYLKFLKIREKKGFDESQKVNLNIAFLGNPGTGKTTVAKMLGKIYQSLDLLSKGHVHEVGRVDLVGEFIGQTAPKVKKAIEKARGGILFVDEAYSLTDRGDDGKDFGREVVEVLIKEMSDGKGDLAIIFAGYPKEMESFLNVNPGMKSRVSNRISFPDYTPTELMLIADYAATKRGVTLTSDSERLLLKNITEAYRNRTEHFGNARFVNGIIEECKQNMALRLMKSNADIEALEEEKLSTILLEDVERTFGLNREQSLQIPIDEAMYNEALAELHQLTGLQEVKRDVDEMAKLARYYTEIGRDVRKAFSMHTVFTGNPGTGKTTVARILVKIYKALGVLNRGHLIECDRKSLVAGFIGQTAIKTGELIESALGGGLFIDEAYALTQGGVNDFGKEAVDTLLKTMEDKRGEFITIVAGYPEEMKQFLEMNPGLISRFDKTLHFPDYTTMELFEIAKSMFEEEGLSMDEQATEHLEKYITRLLEHKHKYFGNARTVRKIVKEVTRRQNLRLANIDNTSRTSEMVKTITQDDVSNFKLIEQNENNKKGIGFR